MPISDSVFITEPSFRIANSQKSHNNNNNNRTSSKSKWPMRSTLLYTDTDTHAHANAWISCGIRAIVRVSYIRTQAGRHTHEFISLHFSSSLDLFCFSLYVFCIFRCFFVACSMQSCGTSSRVVYTVQLDRREWQYRGTVARVYTIHYETPNADKKPCAISIE